MYIYIAIHESKKSILCKILQIKYIISSFSQLYNEMYGYEQVELRLVVKINKIIFLLGHCFDAQLILNYICAKYVNNEK